MKNHVFDAAVAEFKSVFGASSELDSGNGVRFTKGGVATVYHSSIAAGNSTEIAFNPAKLVNNLVLPI